MYETDVIGWVIGQPYNNHARCSMRWRAVGDFLAAHPRVRRRSCAAAMRGGDQTPLWSGLLRAEVAEVTCDVTPWITARGGGRAPQLTPVGSRGRRLGRRGILGSDDPPSRDRDRPASPRLRRDRADRDRRDRGIEVDIRDAKADQFTSAHARGQDPEHRRVPDIFDRGLADAREQRLDLVVIEESITTLGAVTARAGFAAIRFCSTAHWKYLRIVRRITDTEAAVRPRFFSAARKRVRCALVT